MVLGREVFGEGILCNLSFTTSCDVTDEEVQVLGVST